MSQQSGPKLIRRLFKYLAPNRCDFVIANSECSIKAKSEKKALMLSKWKGAF